MWGLQGLVHNSEKELLNSLITRWQTFRLTSRGTAQSTAGTTQSTEAHAVCNLCTALQM